MGGDVEQFPAIAPIQQKHLSTHWIVSMQVVPGTACENVVKGFAASGPQVIHPNSAQLNGVWKSPLSYRCWGDGKVSVWNGLVQFPGDKYSQNNHKCNWHPWWWSQQEVQGWMITENEMFSPLEVVPFSTGLSPWWTNKVSVHCNCLCCTGPGCVEQ